MFKTQDNSPKQDLLNLICAIRTIKCPEYNIKTSREIECTNSSRQGGQNNMSQSNKDDSDSEEASDQHNEDAQFDAEFGLFWRDLEMGAKLNTAGTAVSAGAKKLEAFMKELVRLTKIVAATAVTITLILTIRALNKSN